MNDKQMLELAAKAHPCDTCNAARNNDLNRIIRCGTCKYIPDKMPSKYQPEIGRAL